MHGPMKTSEAALYLRYIHLQMKQIGILSKEISADEEKKEDIFVSHYGAFFERASLQVKEIQEKFDAMTKVYSNLSQWLGEDPRGTEPATKFLIFWPRLTQQN